MKSMIRCFTGLSVREGELLLVMRFNFFDFVKLSTVLLSCRDKNLSIDFMKKYIHIAKCIKPTLTEEAGRAIADEYTRLRARDLDCASDGVARTQPITARTLETLIRLSTAHARARMSKQITKEDATAAIELIQFAVFEKVTLKEKKRRRANDGEGSDSQDDDGDDGDGDEGETEGRSRSQPKRSRRQNDDENSDLYDIENEVDTEEALGTLKDLRRAAARDAGQPPDSEEMDTEESQPSSVALSDSRYAEFGMIIAALFSNERSDSLQMSTVNEWLARHNFDESEVEVGVAKMQQEGKVMLSEGILFLI